MSLITRRLLLSESVVVKRYINKIKRVRSTEDNQVGKNTSLIWPRRMRVKKHCFLILPYHMALPTEFLLGNTAAVAALLTPSTTI